jgi:translocation and assembly module TamA
LGEAAAQPGRAQTLHRQLLKNWSLPAGAAFTQALWSNAKTASLVQARSDGYLMARWQTTEARIDAQNNQAVISLRLDSGPLFQLGDIHIEGLQHQQESSIRRLAGFAPGDAYTERTLLDFQERLQAAGLFDSVSVDIDADPQHAAAARVLVRVRESRLQDATASIGYSANTGQRVALEHVHRRPLDLNLRSKLKVEMGRAKRLLETELTSNTTPGMYRNLFAAKIERLEANSEIVDTASLRLGRLQETPRQDRSYFVEALHGQLQNSAGITSADARSINYQWTWKHIDHPLLPSDGWVASTQVAAGVSRGSAGGSGPFARGWARLRWYQPITRQWFASARVEAGEVFARNELELPDALLFRAGGDDSVRGHGYRSLGPVGIDGLTRSGRVLWAGSVELARTIAADKPQYLGAVFIDAGQAADSWRGFRPTYGYGLGFRWRSPVGPLRVDLAWPEGGAKPRLHFSVGVAF